MAGYSAAMNQRATRGGRPRSQQAREAVLQAVDDLLVEVGYAAMTMKGIAERAGVGRQTVYRWWSTKAQILLEASVADAQEELAVAPGHSPLAELVAYLEALREFLTRSIAGSAYRALLAAAQQDPAVAALIASRDPLGDSAQAVLRRLGGPGLSAGALEQAAARLVGPTFFWITVGRDPRRLDLVAQATAVLDLLTATETPAGHGSRT